MVQRTLEVVAVLLDVDVGDFEPDDSDYEVQKAKEIERAKGRKRRTSITQMTRAGEFDIRGLDWEGLKHITVDKPNFV